MSRNRELANLIAGGFTEADIPNLSANKITSGTFADARLSQSSVRQHAQSFDDNKIVNDISTLGLRVHTQENLNASNTNSASFDVFQDASGVSNLTNVIRSGDEHMSTGEVTFGHQTNARGYTYESDYEFWIKSDTTNGSTSVVSSGSRAISSRGSFTHSTDQAKIGGSSLKGVNYSSGINLGGTNTNFSSKTNYTISYWVYMNTFSNPTIISSGVQNSQAVWSIGFDGSYHPQLLTGNGWLWINRHISNHITSLNTWEHHQWVKEGNTISFYINGVVDSTLNNATFTAGNTGGYNAYIGSYMNSLTGLNGYIDEWIMIPDIVYRPTAQQFGGRLDTTSATGSFEGNAITTSSTNNMGAVITYEDASGTNVLNTDIILQLSADNGSNYTTATLTALPDFATGIKMAKVNDLSVTAGTQLKYKISFANQSSGVKQARIRGVSLQY